MVLLWYYYGIIGGIEEKRGRIVEEWDELRFAKTQFLTDLELILLPLYNIDEKVFFE